MCWRNLNCLRKCSTVNKDFNQNKNNSQLSTVNSKRKFQRRKKKKQQEKFQMKSKKVHRRRHYHPVKSCFYLENFWESLAFILTARSQIKWSARYIYRRHILYMCTTFAKFRFTSALFGHSQNFRPRCHFKLCMVPPTSTRALLLEPGPIKNGWRYQVTSTTKQQELRKIIAWTP